MFVLLGILFLAAVNGQAQEINHLPATCSDMPIGGTQTYMKICMNVSNFSQITSSPDKGIISYLIISDSPLLVLREEDFSNTQMKRISYFTIVSSNMTSFNPELFQGIDALNYLNLAFNNLTAIKERTFKGLRQLFTIILNDNQIHTVAKGTFTKVIKLYEIDLSNNCLSNITALAGLGQLGIVRLGNNLLTSINEFMFRGSTSLSKVELQFNKITFIHQNAFETNRNLVDLNLKGNPLETLDSRTFRNNILMKDLNLSYNNMANLQNFPLIINSLQNLYLSHCNISSIPSDYFSRLPNLKDVYLGGNNLDATEIINLTAESNVTFHF